MNEYEKEAINWSNIKNMKLNASIREISLQEVGDGNASAVVNQL